MATKLTSCEELAAYRKMLGAKRDPNRTCVTVCGGTGCRACQGLDVAAAFRKAFQEHALEGKVDLRVTGCLGFCEHGPVVTLRPKGLIYVKVTAADAKEIVEKTVLRGEEIERLFIKDPQTKQAAAHPRGDSVLQAPDAGYFRRQLRSRSPEHRRLPACGRLHRPGQGPHDHEAGADH